MYHRTISGRRLISAHVQHFLADAIPPSWSLFISPANDDLSSSSVVSDSQFSSSCCIPTSSRAEKFQQQPTPQKKMSTAEQRKAVRKS
jgi:hypothetical protein